MKETKTVKFIAIKGMTAIDALMGLQTELGKLSEEADITGKRIEFNQLLLNQIVEPAETKLDIGRKGPSMEVSYLAVSVITTYEPINENLQIVDDLERE